MTPEEKANELIEKFKSFSHDILTTMDSVPCIISDIPTEKTAKQCAAICVHEVLNVLDAGAYNGKKEIDYWQQVLNHINNKIQ